MPDSAIASGLRIAQTPVHVGAIKSAIPGRTDHIPLRVPPGCYVIPADIVSAIGEGNSDAGHKVLERTLGAMAQSAKGVDIMAAGGEFVVSREAVSRIGGGDLKHGHEILDHWVKVERAKLIKTLRKLPGPKTR